MTLPQDAPRGGGPGLGMGGAVGESLRREPTRSGRASWAWAWAGQDYTGYTGGLHGLIGLDWWIGLLPLELPVLDIPLIFSPPPLSKEIGFHHTCIVLSYSCLTPVLYTRCG